MQEKLSKLLIMKVERNSMATNAQKEKRTWTGVVISDKMDKTVVVEVTRTFKHPSFHKFMKATNKFKVHDEKNEAKEGDLVEFYEGRPVSKTKYMYLARVIKAHTIS